MQFKKFLFLFYFLLSFLFTKAQINSQNIRFISPVDFQILLSGNYGELRTTHFHAGIDIKTGGVIGKKVHSVSDGYISRIKISTNSYGKAIYINHPNGLTTVYGHLDKFNDKIRYKPGQVSLLNQIFWKSLQSRNLFFELVPDKV